MSNPPDADLKDVLPEVVRNAEQGRYEIHLDGVLAGQVDYHDRGTVRVMPHTEVDPAHQGQGLAGALVQAALDDARAEGMTVEPACPYVATWIRRHPAYADLVAP